METSAPVADVLLLRRCNWVCSEFCPERSDGLSGTYQSRESYFEPLITGQTHLRLEELFSCRPRTVSSDPSPKKAWKNYDWNKIAHDAKFIMRKASQTGHRRCSCLRSRSKTVESRRVLRDSEWLGCV